MKNFAFSIIKAMKKFLSGKHVEKIPGVLWVYGILVSKFKPQDIILANIQGSKMYIDPKDESIGVPMLVEGYEKNETKLFKKYIKENMGVIDIGANIGYYSLLAAKLVGKNGKVYAFEPETANYKMLLKNIEINGYKNIVSEQKALSNKNGKTNLFLSKVNCGEPSFCKLNISTDDGFIEVETIRLDDVIKDTRIDFIKMDVQGAEGLVLEGAENILKNNNLKIMMEFWPAGLSNMGTDPQRLLTKLQQNGFKISIIDKSFNQPHQSLIPAELMKFINNNQLEYVNIFFEK
jgi:FkbM family methyltransferase